MGCLLFICPFKSRIVGGDTTVVNEFPMMAALKHDEYFNIICGATIVSNFHAVTAGHCVSADIIQYFQLIVGEHNVTVSGIFMPYIAKFKLFYIK